MPRRTVKAWIPNRSLFTRRPVPGSAASVPTSARGAWAIGEAAGLQDLLWGWHPRDVESILLPPRLRSTFTDFAAIIGTT
jgi:hypothetical protein